MSLETRRKVAEWIGADPGAKVPARVKERILASQEGRCALSGVPFSPASPPEFDHITPLRDGGEHRESNLQAISGHQHKLKTAREAMVRAKVERLKASHLGYAAGSCNPIPGSRKSKWKRKLNGQVVLRD